MVLIPNYGCGNLASIVRMLEYCDIEARISNHPDELFTTDKIILAGVGSFDYGMNSLNSNGWSEVMKELVKNDKISILGICLGMQLMCNYSEEGQKEGLGWFDVGVKKFDFLDTSLKIPHMGWNSIVKVEGNSDLFKSEMNAQKFYFVHSFHVDNPKANCVAALTSYGYDFPSALQKDKLYGVQFHPEKSHRFGMNLLKNFCLENEK